MRVSGITAPVLWATLFAMTLFAGNSLLNRMALLEEGMPPLFYVCLRMSSGAAVLWLLVRAKRTPAPPGGSWLSALALAAYMIFFSLAYQDLPAAVGTLIIAAAASMAGSRMSHAAKKASRKRSRLPSSYSWALLAAKCCWRP